MNKYDSYKDSGIKWIGEIPSHWEVKKVKYTSTINDDTLPDKTDEEFEIEYVDISSIQSGVGITRTENLTFKVAPSRARRLVKEGDIIVSTVRTYLKAIAKIVRPKSNLVVSTGFAVIRPREINSDYAGYLFYHENLLGEIVSRSVGVSYPAINSSEIGTIRIPLPKKDEQTAIAAYLDRKTAEIDELIADKRRLLELYEEEKTAIINQAVTKGLNHDWEGWEDVHDFEDQKEIKPSGKSKKSRFRHSGIDWLGEIPEHWEVKRLKFVAVLRSGNNIVSEQIKEQGEYPVYGGNGVRGFFSEFTHEGNYILIGRQGAYCGNIKFGNGKFWASEHAVVLTPKTHYEVKYLGELLRSMNLGQYSVSAAQPGLAVEAIKNLTITFPSIKEQQTLVNHIEAECARIDAKKARTEKLIELLTEYRTALISEVVTGKVKVL